MNYLGLKNDDLKSTVEALNKLLANYNVYYQKLRNFHWNIQGENFFDLHNQFEDLYNDARLKIDEVAERILTLRHKPLSTMRDFLDKSDVEEVMDDLNDRDMVKEVLSDHGILIKHMRKVMEKATNAEDEGTNDLIGGFLSDMEKRSWMLDAWHNKQQKPVVA